MPSCNDQRSIRRRGSRRVRIACSAESLVRASDRNEPVPNRITTRGAFVVALIGAVLGVFSTGSVSAQESMLDDGEWRRGYHGFSVLCQSLGFEIQDDPNEWRRKPANRSLLVIFGDQSFIPLNLVDYINEGGALLVASDRDGRNRMQSLGVRFYAGPFYAASADDCYDGLQDCPIVSRFVTDNPAVAGLNNVVTNRPGYLSLGRPYGLSQLRQRGPIAELPPLQYEIGSRRLRSIEMPFAVAFETGTAGRALFIADQSVFANQMIVIGDNARFAQQSLAWLREVDGTLETRDNILVISDRQVLPPLDPSEVDVVLPPPNPADVINALRSLPPDLLIDFGNSVVAAVEDEGVMNDLLSETVNRPSDRQLRRFILLTLAIGIGLILLWRILFGASMHDRFKQLTNSNGEPLEADTPDGAYERFLAAHELLRSFQIHVADGLGPVSEATIGAIGVEGNHGATRRMRQDMKELARGLRRFQRNEWTERRLANIETQIGQWKAWYDSGILLGQPQQL